MRPNGFRVSPKFNDKSLEEERNRHTGTRGRPYEDGDRDWNDGSTSQETPHIVSSHQKLGENIEQIVPQSLQREPTLLIL